jgi:hypothetical protein
MLHHFQTEMKYRVHKQSDFKHDIPLYELYRTLIILLFLWLTLYFSTNTRESLEVDGRDLTCNIVHSRLSSFLITIFIITVFSGRQRAHQNFSAFLLM